MEAEWDQGQLTTPPSSSWAIIWPVWTFVRRSFSLPTVRICLLPTCFFFPLEISPEEKSLPVRRGHPSQCQSDPADARYAGVTFTVWTSRLQWCVEAKGAYFEENRRVASIRTINLVFCFIKTGYFWNVSRIFIRPGWLYYRSGRLGSHPH